MVKLCIYESSSIQRAWRIRLVAATKGEIFVATVETAHLNDLEEIVKIDYEIVGDDHRRSDIKQALDEKRCLIVQIEDAIVGFLIYDTHFFGCSFISLIMISPSQRRRGFATALLKYFEKISPTKKIFSSTNQSNHRMRKVFNSIGYVQSGFVENLDEGDPEIVYFKFKIDREEEEEF